MVQSPPSSLLWHPPISIPMSVTKDSLPESLLAVSCVLPLNSLSVIAFLSTLTPRSTSPIISTPIPVLRMSLRNLLVLRALMGNLFLFLSVQTLQAHLFLWFLTSSLHQQILKQPIPVQIPNFLHPWREPLLTLLRMALLQSVETHLLHPCL